jgi:SAM-dependent methyltransferase
MGSNFHAPVDMTPAAGDTFRISPEDLPFAKKQVTASASEAVVPCSEPACDALASSVTLEAASQARPEFVSPVTAERRADRSNGTSRSVDPESSEAAAMPVPYVQDRRIDEQVLELLRCPRCRGELSTGDEAYTCKAAACQYAYPVSKRVPILVDPEKSVFDIETFTRQEATFFRPIPEWRRVLSEMIPEMSKNVAAERVYARLRSLLVAANKISNVLVVGGGVTGSGMESLLNDKRIRLIETDAAIAERTQLICDGHDLPFADASMDAVVVQAVLEHVVDPVRCVEEIFRVLKPGGLVYSDTPFMQQVHGRQFDFTRFTRLGHRRLFRKFDEVESGITCGPGMALAWSLRYFFMSLSDHPGYRAVASAGSRLAFWWLTLLDPWLVTRASANDAASAFFFLGRKGDKVLSDRELLRSYVGGQ